MKRCQTCKIEKPLDMFIKNRSTKDGYQGYCKECEIVHKHNFYRNHPNRLHEYYVKHKNKRIKYAQEHREERLKYYSERRRRIREENSLKNSIQ